MQRTLLIVLATAVVAAGIAAGVTIMVTGDDETVVVSPLPTFTPNATVEVITPTPGATGDATASPGETAEPEDTDEPEDSAAPQATEGVQVRSAKSVDCDDEPQFCSSTDEVKVVNGEPAGLKEAVDPGSSSRPQISMESAMTIKDGTDYINADVVVENKTSHTFRFAKREIVLDVYKNGKLWKTLVTTGEGFDMTPNGKMTGEFQQPVTDDGTYRWEAKVWYYRK